MEFTKKSTYTIIFSFIFLISPIFANEYLIVVNKDAGINSLTKAELRQIYSGEKTAWENGTDITLVNFVAGSEMEIKFTKDVLGMSSDQAKKHYLKKVFAGVLSSAPEEGKDAKSVISLIKENEGAIGYVPTGSNSEGTVEINLK